MKLMRDSRLSDPTAPLALIKGLRSQIRNWWFVGPVTWLVMRCPPRRFLSTSSLARQWLTLRLRSGTSIRCRINECMAFVEVFVLRDYDIPDFDWQSVRTIVDVGANIGIATVWFAQRAKEARILAVEPSPAALPALESNLGTNLLNARVTIVALALGGTPGVGYLMTSGSTVEARVTSSSLPHARTDQPVAVTTLEQLLSDRQLSSVDVLKLDCEGAEYDVLLSVNATLLGRIDTIVGEYHQVDGYQPSDLKLHLELCGFSVRLRPHPRDPTLGRFIARRAARPRTFHS